MRWCVCDYARSVVHMRRFVFACVAYVCVCICGFWECSAIHICNVHEMFSEIFFWEAGKGEWELS